jgi:hypothetical protein
MPDGGADAVGSTGAAGATGTAGTSGAAGTTSAAGTTGAAGATGAAGTTVTSMCPDLDADGVGDCTQTVLANAAFDTSTSGWSAEPGATVSWSSAPPATGALSVRNVDGDLAHATSGWTSSGAAQCLTLPAGATGQTLGIAVRAYLAGGQGAGAAQFVLDYHFDAHCADARFPLPYQSAQVTTTGAWQTLAGTTGQLPVGVLAVGVRLLSLKPVAQPTFEVFFDDVLARVK